VSTSYGKLENRKHHLMKDRIDSPVSVFTKICMVTTVLLQQIDGVLLNNTMRGRGGALEMADVLVKR
jgi:hypothetical protein